MSQAARGVGCEEVRKETYPLASAMNNLRVLFKLSAPSH